MRFKKNEDELYRAYKESKGKDYYKISNPTKVTYTSNVQDKQTNENRRSWETKLKQLQGKAEDYTQRAKKLTKSLELSDSNEKINTHIPYQKTNTARTYSSNVQRQDSSKKTQYRVLFAVGVIIIIILALVSIGVSNYQIDKVQEEIVKVD